MMEFEAYTFGVERVFNETAYHSAYVEVAGMDVLLQLLFAVFVLMLLGFPLRYLDWRRGRGGR